MYTIKILICKIFTYIITFHQTLRYSIYRDKYDLHKSFVFNGNEILFYDAGEISIESHSYIGAFSTIQASKGYEVKIGKHCKISHNVRMYTQTSIADWDFSVEPIPQKFGSIEIGDYVWIGANVFINPGVKIGKNSIIGSNSVVTKDILPNTINGGVPCKLIREKKIEPC
jgi:maltose O-acetyltransferase